MDEKLLHISSSASITIFLYVLNFTHLSSKSCVQDNVSSLLFM